VRRRTSATDVRRRRFYGESAVSVTKDAPGAVDYAERYAREIPKTRLVRIKSAGHIPMENDPQTVAGALAEFFAAER
jgi:pimeloyl-ACP methyl ester carboxylesterase